MLTIADIRLIHCVHTSAGGLLLPEFHTHFRVGVFVTVEDPVFLIEFVSV